MAVVLAYTSPALGHLLPFCALLTELASRGHQVHVRTLAAGVELTRGLGFATEPVAAGIEALQSIDPFTDSMMRSVASTVEVLTRRAALEVEDFRTAVRAVEPDLMVLDANCWGAMAAAEAQPRPWAVLSPFVPYLRSPGSPPFGAGAAPMRGPVGRVRDWGIGLVTGPLLDRPLARGMRPVREALGLSPVRSADELLRRAPHLLAATGKPFEYEHTDWGASVSMIGPASFDPPRDRRPAWLDDIDLPVVLVTTSSVRQADEALIRATIEALDGQPVHVVATSPAGDTDAVRHSGNVTFARFVPHSAVLDRAVCVVTHGGMGITQKALARGIPVCAVPFGRDQFEVAWRVQVARCGTRLPAHRLSVPRLRAAIGAARTMTAGAAAVAAGFAATGGVPRGADIVEQLS